MTHNCSAQSRSHLSSIVVFFIVVIISAILANRIHRLEERTIELENKPCLWTDAHVDSPEGH